MLGTQLPRCSLPAPLCLCVQVNEDWRSWNNVFYPILTHLAFSYGFFPLAVTASLKTPEVYETVGSQALGLWGRCRKCKHFDICDTFPFTSKSELVWLGTHGAAREGDTQPLHSEGSAGSLLCSAAKNTPATASEARAGQLQIISSLHASPNPPILQQQASDLS